MVLSLLVQLRREILVYVTPEVTDLSGFSVEPTSSTLTTDRMNEVQKGPLEQRVEEPWC